MVAGRVEPDGVLEVFDILEGGVSPCLVLEVIEDGLGHVEEGVGRLHDGHQVHELVLEAIAAEGDFLTLHVPGSLTSSIEKHHFAGILESSYIIATEFDHRVPLLIVIIQEERDDLVVNVPLLLQLVEEVLTVLDVTRRSNSFIGSESDVATGEVGDVRLIQLDDGEGVARVAELT